MKFGVEWKKANYVVLGVSSRAGGDVLGRVVVATDHREARRLLLEHVCLRRSIVSWSRRLQKNDMQMSGESFRSKYFVTTTRNAQTDFIQFLQVLTIFQKYIK